MSLAAGWTLQSSQGHDWCSKQLAPALSDFVAHIRTNDGELNPSAMPTEVLREALITAQEEQDWPFVLPRAVVFPTSLYPIEFYFQNERKRFGLSAKNPAQLKTISHALSQEQSALTSELQKRKVLSCEPERIDASRKAISEPGIYRLQHAMLAFRSDEACTITDFVLTGSSDDIVHPLGLPQRTLIAITHSHGDHFSIASLLQLPKATRIVVPRVPCNSMIGINMGQVLKEAGFENVVEMLPGERLEHFDQTITALPFFGEQPWVNFASPDPNLRNWGLTYLVESQGTKSWVLADSGYEFGHDMLEVASELAPGLASSRGTLDYVFSNLRRFFWHPGQIDSSGRYLACYSRDQLAKPEQWPYGQSITLGPEGVGKLLDIVEVKAFYPYAHWWHDQIEDEIMVDNVKPESELVAETARAVSETCHTRFSNWTIGDRIA